jgi:hypothetical protein
MAVDWNQEEVERRIREGANRGVLMGALHRPGPRGTELILEPPKTGRVYRAGASSIRRPPQARRRPATPAAWRDPARWSDPGDVSAAVNWATIYARRLEVGDDKIEPRPYARRALAEKVQEIQDVVATRSTRR